MTQPTQPPGPLERPAASVPAPAPRVGQEHAAPLAASPGGLAAAAFVLSLAKAGRSLLLYDAGNSLVGQFLAEYRARAEAVTADGPLVLDVHPFDLLREGEAVYREEDREKSLAFRLFRDGVRRITFARGVPWPELLAFLEILAVRFAGVRQQEDDVVTLLRKAEFQAIAFAAVEGFEPEEDDPEPDEGRRRRGESAQPPAGFDAPFPLLPPPGPIAWREVPAEALVPLRAEEGPAALAQNGLRLAALLLQEALRGTVPAREVQVFLAEVRDFLIADGALPALATLADLVGRLPAGALRDEVLRSLGDPRLLAAVVAAMKPGSGELPPEAARLLPLVPGGAALDLLAAEPDAGRRAALVRIVEGRLPADAEAVVARLASLGPEVARALVRSVVARAPASAGAAAAALLDHADEQLQIEGLRALEVGAGAAGDAPGGAVPAGKLLALLHAQREPLRVAAVRVLERRGERGAFGPLQAALTERRDCSQEEAAALGRALAGVDPPRAAALFGQWLAVKKGLLGRLTQGKQEELLRWAAVAGLGVHPSPEAAAQIEAVAKGADEALRRHCFATLARRRHEGARHG